MNEYKEIELKIPTMTNIKISDATFKKLINNSYNLTKVYSFIELLKKFENSYTIEYEESGKKLWIKELKGVSFDTLEEARLYAFIDYCNKIKEK